MGEPVNWQELDHDSFLSWVILHAAVDKQESDGDEAYEALTEATDKFRRVVLTMQINGVEVNPLRFLGRVEQHMKSSIESAAREYCMELLGDKFTELEEVLENAKRSILDKFPMREDKW